MNGIPTKTIGDREIAGWSVMGCDDKDAHAPHSWSSRFTNFGPYACPGKELQRREGRMTETAESFKPQAWTGEDGEIVIYGTHRADLARQLTLTHLVECGFAPGDEEWPQDANRIEFYESMMSKRWTQPKGDEERFDALGEWQFGAVPYMRGEPDYYAGDS